MKYSLAEYYSAHQGKISDKWASYLDTYHGLFEPYRNRAIDLLEIGIQNGGSLEIWAEYFPFAKVIVGCDINQACANLIYSDKRISVVVADANTDSAAQAIASHSTNFDIIIDDGSHRSSDIIRSFTRYFERVRPGGIFVVEDLHCSYWKEFEGGLFDPGSSMAFFKRLADVINYEHWGVARERMDVLKSFCDRYGIKIPESVLAEIHSIEFQNSICVVKKNHAARNELGQRVITGNVALINAEELAASRGTSSIAPAQEENEWSRLLLPEDELLRLRVRTADLQSAHDDLSDRLRERDLELSKIANELVMRNSQFEHERSQGEALSVQNGMLGARIEVLNRTAANLQKEVRAARTQLDQILASTSWRVTMPLRRVSVQMARLRHLTFTLTAMLGRFVGSGQIGQIPVLLLHGPRLWKSARRIKNSGLFDAAYYVRQYPDVAAYAGGGLVHYIIYGSKEGRSPHPLFDEPDYRANYPEIQKSRNGGVALLHYLDNDNNNPNRWFDSKWYKLQYPDVSKSGLAPLAHYVVFGADEDRDPSARFSTEFYKRMNPDVASSGLNPLVHYLRHGQAEGRHPVPPNQVGVRGRPVTDSEIHLVKSPGFSRRAALFVAHAPSGALKPHVMHYLRALKDSGIAVTLLVAADRPFAASAELLSTVEGLYVRRNEGLDFAAWAHVLRLDATYYDVDVLYLLNDSLIGPFNQRELDQIVNRVDQSPAEVIGLTENYERAGWHLQSYFLALKSRVLKSVVFQRFVRAVEVLDDKDEVINQYELRMSPLLKRNGFACEALFLSPGTSNPTIYRWHDLIRMKFPFIKVMTLRDTFPGVDIRNWKEIMAERGFDTKLAEATLKEAKQPIVPDRESPLVPALKSSEAVRSIAFISPFNFDNGLGAAGRSYISAMRRTGLNVNLHPIKTPFHLHRQICPPVDVQDFDGPADAAIIHLNPDGWDSVLSDDQRRVIEAARRRIGLWVWETTTIPENWRPVLGKVDAIWVPSSYCAAAFRAVTDLPIHVVPHVVSVEEAPFDSDTASKKILYIFDGSSYLSRKNPHALVRAFAASQLAGRGWTLSLKTKHLKHSGGAASKLRTLVESTPSVMLLDQTMSREELSRLWSGASIYASPHSSEGFGLTVAEAMARGKLVVATNYSGPSDFLDDSCGFPVDYALGTLAENDGAYEKGSLWAKVDEENLAQRLLEAAECFEQGDRRKSSLAKQRVLERLSADAIAQCIIAALRCS